MSYSLLYNEIGEGNDVVFFLHGNALNSSIFQYQKDENFLPSWKKVFVELPGHKSPRLNDYSFENISQILLDFTAKFSPSKMGIIGHSYGANLIPYLVQGLKSQVAKVVITGAFPVYKPLDFANMMLENAYVPLYFKDNISDEDMVNMAKINGLNNEVLPWVVDAIKESDISQRLQVAASLGNPDAMLNQEKVLIEWGSEICFINGELDSVWNIKALAKRPYKFWQGTAHQIPNAGHMSFYDTPSEFNQLVTQFFNS